jgi:hypothetical protein
MESIRNLFSMAALGSVILLSLILRMETLTEVYIIYCLVLLALIVSVIVILLQ